MKILSNYEYNQTIECMNNANMALKELKLKNDMLEAEIKAVKNNLVLADVIKSVCSFCGDKGNKRIYCSCPNCAEIYMHNAEQTVL